MVRGSRRGVVARSAACNVVVAMLMALALLAAAQSASAETYGEAVEGTPGVAHFWPMGEASGSAFADAVGGANAEASGGVTLGEPGGLVEDLSTSVAFDGSSGAAQASVDLSGTHKLTIEFWMKWHAYGADDHLALEFTPNFNEHPGGFIVDPDATPGSDFDVTIGNGSTYNNVMFARPSAEQWHYYAFVIDTEAPAGAEITPYVDGRPVPYTKLDSAAGAGSFADSTLFWMSRDAGTLFGAGSMQDLALYDTTLSSGTVLEHYALGEHQPQAAFSSTPLVATAGVPVRFDASASQSPGSPITDYAWDFDGGKGYGTDSEGSSAVTHTFSSAGTYTVDLRVTDGASATGTVSETVTVGAALPAYEQAVEGTEGLAHFWPMGDSSESLLLADVFDGADANVNGGVTLGESGALSEDPSTSALFNGSTGAAQAGVDLSSTHRLTIELWMKWSAYGADDHLALEFTPDFNTYTGGFIVDPDATPGSDFAVSIGKGSTSNTVFFERPSAEEWHYYAFVIDTEAPGEAEITPYVDGHEVSYTKTASHTGAGAFADSTLFWMSRDASTLFGAGSMQDLALYDTTLSAGAIAEHYDLGEGGPRASFVSQPVAATAGVPVHLDASGSSSPAGAITDYAWDFDGGKGYETDSESSPTVTHTFSSAGTYTVDLRVKDGTGATATVSKTIVVGAALGQYEQAVEDTAGLAHFWPMGESSGSLFADVFAGANGTVQGGVTPGEPGGLVEDPATSALFDGSTGAAQATVNLSNTHQLTIEFWMKWHAYGADDKLALELTPNFNEHPGGFLVDPDATPGSDFAVAIGQASAGHNNNVLFERPSAEQWHYYAFVIDTEASGETEITPYVDGHAVSYTKLNEETGAGNFAGSTLYWMSRDASSLFGAGSMQDLALYDSTLSPDMILEHYDYGENTYLVANTTPPSIEGTAWDGQTLTANPGVWTGFEPISYAYRWQRCNLFGEECAGITDATGPTYRLEHGDVGSTLRVEVTAANSAGPVSIVSGSSGPVAALAPSSFTIPTISGIAKDGQTLSASTGIWTGTPSFSHTYQWQSCNARGEECSNIESATSSTYTIAEADVGARLRVVVTATNAAGSASATSSLTAAITPPMPPSSTERSTIDGRPEEGQTLTANANGWNGATPISYAYQWQSCDAQGGECANIEAASEKEYSLDEGDIGTTLRVIVKASNAGGFSSSTSATTSPITSIGRDWAYGQQIHTHENEHVHIPARPEDEPVGLAYGPEGNLWVVDQLSNRVEEFNANGEYLMQFGGEGSGEGELFNPKGIALDAKGDVWVADLWNGRIDEFNHKGQYLKAIVTLEDVGLVEPDWIAIDAHGDIWVSGVQHVEVFSPDGEHLRTVGSTGAGELKSPEGIAADRHGHVWVASYATDRVKEFNEEGQYVGQIGSEGAGEGQFDGPYGVAADSRGDVWVGDIGNDRVEEFSAQGEYLTQFEGKEGEFRWWNELMGIAADGKGNVWVTDTQVDEISKLVSGSPSAPSDLTRPTITGTPQEFQPLRAHVGKWNGSPIEYSYEWQICETSEETSCVGVTESPTVPVYAFGLGTAGYRARLVVTATNQSGSTSSASEMSSVLSAPEGSACTDYWIGGSTGLVWQDASAWSTGSVPGLEDVACIGTGMSVEIREYTAEVKAVQGGGSVNIEKSGLLELTDAMTASSVGTLALGEDGKLTGPGSLHISKLLYWDQGSEMSGSGATVLESNAIGSVGYFGPCSSGVRTLSQRTLINEGVLTLPYVALALSEGARIENKGTFKDNASRVSGSSLPTCDKWSMYPISGGATPEILNRGLFEKTTRGEGVVAVGVNFSNQGVVEAKSGKIEFDNGGISEEDDTGIWKGNGEASLVFGVGSEEIGGGTFLIDEEADLSAVTVEGATVTRVSDGPPSSTALPGVSGEAVEGETLSASPGGWHGSKPLSFDYQWQTCNGAGEECTNISGATNEAYVLDGEDVSATLRALVTATNTEGSVTRSSPPSSVVVSVVSPANTTPPAISGTGNDGETLRASSGTWTGAPSPSYTYQWESCNATGEECAPIEYATEPEYELGDGDIATTLRVEVTATNASGSAQATSAASSEIESEPPSELEAPSVSGTPDVHQVLRANAGAWTGAAREVDYQWESCNSTGGECADIGGATDAEYDLSEGDAGGTLRVRIGLRSHSGALTDTSPVTSVIGSGGQLANTVAPSVTGTLQVDQTLTANSGTWSDSSTVGYAYQWQSCDKSGAECKDIEGANGETYTPSEHDEGDALRVLVTASDKDESSSKISSATQPIAPVAAPTVEKPPAISGTALEGQTLTTSNGEWSGEGSISYAYQWERCDGEGVCTAIEGATVSSYTLTGSDVSHTVIALVTATDIEGSSAGVSVATASIEPEDLTQLSSPSISGLVQEGATLSAGPGIWSGAGAISYVYQWERCNAEGAECASIEGASESLYTVVSGDLGSALRLKVTVSGPHDSETVYSAHTVGTPSGEVSVEEAQEVAEQNDPSILAPSTKANLEERTIEPSLSDSEEGIASESTLTSSTISKETPGEFAVNTPEAELSLLPLESSSNATTTPTIVNGTVALFANMWPSTDALIRPDALGATTILQIRSAQAPRTYSWDLRLGPDEQLRQLPDGRVAVVEVAAATSTTNEESSAEPESHETGEGEPESTVEKEESEQEEAEAETETPPPSLPEAPQTSSPPTEPVAGRLEPQDTQVQYEAASSSMTSAEEQVGSGILMVIETPRASDAEGNTVPTSLKVSGDTITVTVKPEMTTAYPTLIDLRVAALSDTESAARDPLEYGLADNRPETFATKNGQPFDTNLETGPMHIKTARLTIPYDVVVSSVERREAREEEKQHKAGNKLYEGEKKRLITWLREIGENELPSPSKEHLEPYITLTIDKQVKAKCESPNPKDKEHCQSPSVPQFRQAFKKLFRDLVHGNQSKKLPAVTLWGSWNEPDTPTESLVSHPQRAAMFWQVAESVVAEGKHPCRCKVVAGEFSHYFPAKGAHDYVEHYRAEVKTYCGKCWNDNHRLWHRDGVPHAWGFHDYEDVMNGNQADAKGFADFTANGLGKPKLWVGEAAVELENRQTETGLTLGCERSGSECSAEQRKEERSLQRKAAEDFLTLHTAKAPNELSRFERIYYYEYRGTLPGKLKEFDSGLLNSNGIPRESYCVLAYADQECPGVDE